MNLSPVCVLLGEENYLKEAALLKIKNNCFPKEKESSLSFNYIQIDGRTAVSSQIISECQQLPFMSGIRLITVRDADKVIDDKLLEYIKDPVKTTCLILIINKIDKRLTAYKILQANSQMQEFDQPNEKDVSLWIQQYIKSRKKYISPFDASRIAGMLNNNLSQVQQELEKIILYAGNNNTITYSDIEKMIPENQIKDCFALTESIQNKDTSNAIKLANKLLEQGNPLQQITGTIRWMLTRLWIGKELLETGNRHNISKELRIPSFFLEKFIRQAEKFKINELKEGFIKLLELEKTIRTYKIPQNLALELLVIQLTQKTSE